MSYVITDEDIAKMGDEERKAYAWYLFMQDLPDGLTLGELDSNDPELDELETITDEDIKAMV